MTTKNSDSHRGGAENAESKHLNQRICELCVSAVIFCYFLERPRRARKNYRPKRYNESRKHVPAVRGQFDAGILPDGQLHVAGELRQQRDAVDFDFRERGVAEIVSTR